MGRNIENDGGMFAYGLFDRVVTDQTGARRVFRRGRFSIPRRRSRPLGGIISNYHTRPPLGFVHRVRRPG